VISETYRAQVDLLLLVLPHLAKEESCAIKGGTAINLFVRDMPRLSVDIDLTWLPFDDAPRRSRTSPTPSRCSAQQTHPALVGGSTGAICAQSTRTSVLEKERRCFSEGHRSG
jgi:hypothetical protein